MSGVLNEGNIDDLLSPKTDRFAKKRKTMSIVPKNSIIEANDSAAIIRVLGWENKEKPRFAVIKAHYVFDPSITFANKKKYVTCLGQGCPLCAAGHKPSDRYALMVEHMNAQVKDASGVSRNVPTRKILLTGQTAIKQLYVKNTNAPKSISDWYITASALAGTPSPVYMFEYKGDYNPEYQVDMNGLENFESLKPDENDVEDAKRLASLQNGAKHQQTSFQAQPYNPGYQAAPMNTAPVVADPWGTPANNAQPVAQNSAPSWTAPAVPANTAFNSAAQQNIAGNQLFTPVKQPDYTTPAPDSTDFNDIPF